LIHIIVSLVTKPQSEQQIKEYTYKKEMFTKESEELKQLSWYKNYRVLSIILLIVTAIVVGFFW